MSQSFLDDDRLVDLLIQQATTGLADDERAELERLLAQHPQADADSIERAVVALTLAAPAPREPLPPALRARLVEQHAALVGNPAANVVPLRPRATTDAAAPPPRRSPGGLGWWAAAAAIVLAVLGWYPRLQSPAPVADAAQQRAQLLAAAPQALRWTFSSGGDATGTAASGDVVWDAATQRGYMRLRNLAANDARQAQYQLWIFDAARDARYPVDGGVFDIPAGQAEVVIPITARLHVDKPALFAVTVERPGGVVVSSRERIAVLAKPAAS
ncbi:MAG TPA: anti-sigma factor [Steroidobacteraceae bacterium]|nr:anti-sigma factor [Steroidobacteraceae bacterium]